MIDRWPLPDTCFRLRTLFIATGTCAMAFAIMARWPLGPHTYLAACVPAFWGGRACLLVANILTGSKHTAAGGAVSLFGLLALCLLFSVLATFVACSLWWLIWSVPAYKP